MDSEILFVLTAIECSIINFENPSYLEVSYQNGFIYIVISRPDYKHYTITERQQIVFDILKVDLPEILKKYTIIADCLDENELTGLFKMYANE